MARQVGGGPLAGRPCPYRPAPDPGGRILQQTQGPCFEPGACAAAAISLPRPYRIGGIRCPVRGRGRAIRRPSSPALVSRSPTLPGGSIPWSAASPASPAPLGPRPQDPSGNPPASRSLRPDRGSGGETRTPLPHRANSNCRDIRRRDRGLDDDVWDGSSSTLPNRAPLPIPRARAQHECTSPPHGYVVHATHSRSPHGDQVGTWLLPPSLIIL